MTDLRMPGDEEPRFDLAFHLGRELSLRASVTPLELTPRGALSPDGRVLWVATRSQSLARVDLRRGVAECERFEAPSLIQRVALLPWCEALLLVVNGVPELRDAETLRPLTPRGRCPGALRGDIAMAAARRLAMEPATEPDDEAPGRQSEVWEVDRASDDRDTVNWRRVAVLPVGAPLRLSADGAVLAGVSRAQRIAAYDIASALKRWDISGEAGSAADWALTPDGRALLWVKSEKGRFHLLRVEGVTGREVWRHPAPEGFVGMTVSPEGAGVARLVGASIDWREVGDGIRARSVQLRAPAGATLQWFIGQPDDPDAPLIAESGGVFFEVCPKRGTVAPVTLPPITRLAVSPNGLHLAGADAEGFIAIWPLAEPHPTSLTAQGEPVMAMEWSSDGRHLAAASARRLTLLDAERGLLTTISLDELGFSAEAVVREVLFAAGDRAVAMRVSADGAQSVCVLAREGLELRWHAELPPRTAPLILDTTGAAIWAGAGAATWRDAWTGIDREEDLGARRQRVSNEGRAAVDGNPPYTLMRSASGRWYADGETTPCAGQEASGFTAVAASPRGERVFAGRADGSVVTFVRGPAPKPAAPPPPVEPPPKPPAPWKPRVTEALPTLEKLARDLTAAAVGGALQGFVGREEEVQRVIEVLCRRTKRNPVLVGPAGVGKTAIVEGIARRIVRGEVPPLLQGARLFSIQPQALASELDRVIAEASRDGVILFIDEVHAIVGTGGAEGRNDVATRFKPALSRDAISVIAATTDDEYRRFIEADGALERRFAPVRVHPLSPAATLEVLRALRDELQRLRGVMVGDEVLERLVSLAQRYMRNRNFPDKGVDLLEQCVAVALATGRQSVSLADAVDVVRRFVDVPLDLDARLPEIVQRLRESALLDGGAIDALHARLQVTTRGIDARPERPNAVLLLTGDAVASAQALSEELAATLFGSAERVIDIDCGGFSHPSDLNRLLGAPPGFIGFDTNLPLHRLAQTPWCVLLLQNVHGCRPEILDVITTALGDGVFTDGRGRALPVSDAIVVLTARGLQATSRRPVGFGADRDDRDDRDEDDPSLRSLSDGLPALCDVVVRRAPTRDAVGSVGAEALLAETARRYAEHGLTLRWDAAVAAKIVDGARAPDRTSIERFIDQRVAPLLLPWLPRPDHPARRVRLRVEAGALAVFEE